MTDYFNSIGTKSTIRGNTFFSYDDSRPELLLDYYKRQARPEDLDHSAVEQMFRRWCLLLSSSFNIVVFGHQSKFNLLEQFNSLYIESGKLKNYKLDNTVNVRLHGLNPISMEKFTHTVFKKTDSSKFDERYFEKFLDNAEKTQTHYTFLLHSFELFHKECEKILDLIFKMYESKPTLVHIIMSVDHINHGILLTNSLKQRLKLCYFDVPYVGSFFHEKTQSVSIIDDLKSVRSKNAQQADKIFEGQLDLQSLKDIYQALQENNRKLMLHIIKNFYDQTLSNSENERPHKESDGQRANRRSQRNQNSTVYSIDRLMSYCESQFLARRSATLRDYLGELEDHGIISLDESRSKVQCQVNFETCKKFLIYAGSL